MFKQTAKTFWRIFSRRIIGFGVLGVIVLTHGGGSMVDAPGGAAPAPVGSNALMQSHGCWAGKAPQGAKAHHAVISLPGGDARYVGQHLTDKAIEQAVFGIDHHLTVYGFCR